MQKSSAHAWHFNTHINENTKISVPTPCWQYWVNLIEAKKIRKTKTFKYMKNSSSICTQNLSSNRQYWVGDYAQLYAIYDWGRNMRFEKCSFICLLFLPVLCFFAHVFYVHQIGVKPNQPYLGNISSKKWPPFLHLWSWYLIFVAYHSGDVDCELQKTSNENIQCPPQVQLNTFKIAHYTLLFAWIQGTSNGLDVYHHHHHSYCIVMRQWSQISVGARH